MSLQLAAQNTASRGRGPDTQLVHMAPQEVAGLHALAKAHGGSLTVNPDTGLPEAGFLSSILPMVIGAGITAATGGAAAPWMIGLGVGGAQTLATGSLQKGLMAGLGAYGGAGLAGGLMSAGASAAANPLAGMEAAALENPAVSGFQAANAAPAAAASPGYNVMTGGFSGVDPMGLNPAMAQAAPVAGPPTAQLAAGAPQVPTATPMADKFSQMGQGFKSLGTETGREAFMGNAASKGVEATGIGGASGLMKYGYAAAMPVMMQGPEAAGSKPKEEPYRYTYDPGRVSDPQAGYSGAPTGERTYFNPVYTRTAAGGGLMDIGPVQAMSDRNEAQTLMANGGQMFNEGGETKAVKPVEQDPYYTMSGQSGDAFKYLMGQTPTRAAPAAPMPAPAPVQAAVPPAAAQPASGMTGLMSAMRGSGSDATMRPYTFDPVTGTFTALPIVNSPSANAGGPATSAQYDYGSYGGDSGGVGDSGSVGDGIGSGMGNSGEGGGAPGEGGWAQGGIAALAQGGQSHLGDYSDGGRLLRGPGDGVSDSIPASIGEKRPARLADGEFVVPARIVSELGNGSTEAGARKLYAMMDRVQSARKKSIGKDRVAVNSRAEKLLPA